MHQTKAHMEVHILSNGIKTTRIEEQQMETEQNLKRMLLHRTELETKLENTNLIGENERKH